MRASSSNILVLCTFDVFWPKDGKVATHLDEMPLCV